MVGSLDCRLQSSRIRVLSSLTLVLSRGLGMLDYSGLAMPWRLRWLLVGSSLGTWYWLMLLMALSNCPFAPLNPKTVENAKETKHYLNVSKPAVVMVPDRVISQSIIQSTPTEIERAKILLVYDGDCVTERGKTSARLLTILQGAILQSIRYRMDTIREMAFNSCYIFV